MTHQLRTNRSGSCNLKLLLFLATCAAYCPAQSALTHLSQWTTQPSYETVSADNSSTAFTIEDDNHIEHVFYNESYAILIIEGAYQNPGWTKVVNPGRQNEKLLRNSLEQRGFHVLVWRDLTGKQLRSTLNEAFSNLGYGQNSRLFFYYYGHGQVMGSDDDPSGPKTFLVPVDAPNPITDKQTFYRIALPLTQIVEYSNEITTKHAFFALEACQAGNIVGFLSGPKVPYPKGYLLSEAIQRPVREFITAGENKEDVLAVSPFTPMLVKAIEEADSNGDGYITGSEIMEYVIEHVPQNSDLQNPEQASTPRAHGDMVFGPVASQVNSPRPVPPLATRVETITKEWRSPGLNVDCNRTNSGRVQAGVSLDSSLNEKVIGATAHYEQTDKVKDLTGPTVEGVPGPTAIINYGFNGLDRNIVGDCPGGGHATIVVTFQVERTVPVLEFPAKL